MKQEFYITLISKNISGELSDFEITQLNEWVNENPANAALKKRVEDSWSHADLYKSNIEINEKVAWENIAGQLDQKEIETPKTKVISMWQKPHSIAATLLFLIAGTWFFINNSTEKTTNYATVANETKTFQLPDGSNVTLNQSSQLSYSDNSANRMLKLVGEGFFEVTHNKVKPFIVHTQETTTTVLGTTFNINANRKNEVIVTLLEGKVSFEAPDMNKIILTPNQKVNYTIENNDLALTTINNENNIAWKTQKLTFKNTKITNVVETINDYFDKNIKLKLNDSNCLFTGSFDNPKYEEVLEVLKFTYDIEVENKNNLSQLTINKCN